jgi:hypothetical protein
MMRRPPVSDARLRHLSHRLHGLGERALYELLRELVAGADPFDRLEAYARLDGDLLSALGGRDLPPSSFYMLEAPAA